MKRIFAAIISLMLLIISCSPTEPINSLTLSVDVSCTEAWLNIKASNVSLPQILEVTRNGETAFSVTLSANDTTLYDSTLSPNKPYTYQAAISSIRNPVSSNKVTATTLDTTNHNFSWQTYTLGDAGAGSSVLNDIAIINDTLAYAVGEIYVNDYTGNPDPYPYCLAKWNGKTWSFKKLYYKDKDYQGNEFISVLSNIRGILALSSTDIWFAAGSIFHWSGIDSIAEFSYRILTPSGLLPGINKLWGNSNNNIYGVGNLGSIVHYTNGNWQKIESGTTSQIYDIWGIENPKHEKIIYCGVLDVLLKLNQQNEVLLIKLPYNTYFWSVWFDSPYKLYGSGNGIYENSNNKWDRVDLLGDRAVSKIRGIGYNNIFGAGTYGLIAHFNGWSWQSYNIAETAQGAYTNLSVKNRIMIAVGFNNGKAIITVGKRN